MRGTASFDARGSYCGRPARGISNLSPADLRQIEAHRAKERPTPWAHLAARFGVNEIDLRQLLDAPNDNAPVPEGRTVPAKVPVRTMLRAETDLPSLWRTSLTVAQIAEVLNIEERSVRRLRDRLGLPPRNGDGA